MTDPEHIGSILKRVMANIGKQNMGPDQPPTPTSPLKTEKNAAKPPFRSNGGGSWGWVRAIWDFLDCHCYHPQKVVGIMPDGKSHGPFLNRDPKVKACCRCGILGKEPH